MSVEVVMPQMGESITEGTVSKWLKAVGERVEKDEAILEISTDKVDAEVPSPGAGILLEIRHNEGETVEVGTVLAVVGAESDEPAVKTPPVQSPAKSVTETAAAAAPAVDEAKAPAPVENPKTQPATAAAAAVGSVEIVMPQMGESITEGTVSKWLKNVGDDIQKDEPLLEISTDKVDAEVPSPAAGRLLVINVQEGETVEVGSVLASVGPAGASAPTAGAATKFVETKTEEPKPVVSRPPERPVTAALPAAAQAGRTANGDATAEELRQTRSSPLVRNIAKEHGVDISRIPGTGLSGRVTKNDILTFIDTGAALRPEDLLKSKPAAVPAPTAEKPAFTPAQVGVSTGDRVEKMSAMRRKIAEHMTFSKQTSAHVTSVYEIDMTNAAKFREKHLEEFRSRYGTKLTYMPFIFQAVTNAIRAYPVVNSQVDGENIIYKGDINLGMAVALDWGLIVPVIKRADTLSLSGLALAANDLADRARAKKLAPDEVAGGTFTITNPGVFGGLFGTPIINQPQVAILCVGTIEKRPKVFTSPEGDDYIAVRQMAYFALTYDHRIVDGADAEKFLANLKQYLESAQFSY
ncbi:MAG: 2-oxoglutarate dehydrogenase, E2 component, dihydrolipoamide succinyltransferase [Acidobacteriota bacterium]